MMKHSLNHHYFKTWSSNMAYVLGFIAADGCVRIKKGRRYVLQFILNAKDRSQLEMIKAELGTSYAIRSVINRGKPGCQLWIHNKALCEDLLALGITPRKSLTLSFPDVPECYERAFLRGYFDGDGGICYIKPPRQNKLQLRATIAGTEQFLLRAEQIIRKHAGTRPKRFNKFSNCNNGQLLYAANEGHKLLSWLYAGDGLALARKQELARLSIFE